jgi:hypothetical protein
MEHNQSNLGLDQCHDCGVRRKQVANPTTNYGFVLPTPTDLVTDLPADFDVALQGVDTRLKALQPGTTEGDLAYSSSTANTNTRLAIGSTGNVLTVAGGVPTWAAPASGGSMTLLSTTTLTGAATITISSISQSYINLYILITGLTVTTGAYTLKLRPGASNANNYTSLAGATVSSANPDYISPGYAGHSASSAVNDYALTIYNYTDTAARKPFHLVGIAKMNSQVEPLGVSAFGATNVTAAISSFELNNDSGGNFTAGTVKIYGVN